MVQFYALSNASPAHIRGFLCCHVASYYITYIYNVLEMKSLSFSLYHMKIYYANPFQFPSPTLDLLTFLFVCWSPTFSI